VHIRKLNSTSSLVECIESAIVADCSWQKIGCLLEFIAGCQRFSAQRKTQLNWTLQLSCWADTDLIFVPTSSTAGHWERWMVICLDSSADNDAVTWLNTYRIRGFSTTMRYINRHYLSIYLSALNANKSKRSTADITLINGPCFSQPRRRQLMHQRDLHRQWHGIFKAQYLYWEIRIYIHALNFPEHQGVHSMSWTKYYLSTYKYTIVTNEEHASVLSLWGLLKPEKSAAVTVSPYGL